MALTVFVDLDDVAAGVYGARPPFEAFRSSEDDRRVAGTYSCYTTEIGARAGKLCAHR